MSTQPRHIQLMDTTLRDGEQTQGVSYSPDEKLNIAKALLQSLHVDRIEVASARVSDGEKNAVSRINQWANETGFMGKVEVLGFVDHTRSVDWIIETGGSVINLLTKGSEKHCHEQLRKTLMPEHQMGQIPYADFFATAEIIDLSVIYIFNPAAALKPVVFSGFVCKDSRQDI